MANIDESRRRVVLLDWVDELRLCRGTIENDSCEKTGLSSTRHEVLNHIEAIISLIESRMPGFDPMAALSEPLSPIQVELAAVTHPARRHDDMADESSRRRKTIAFVHKRKDD